MYEFYFQQQQVSHLDHDGADAKFRTSWDEQVRMREIDSWEAMSLQFVLILCYKDPATQQHDISFIGNFHADALIKKISSRRRKFGWEQLHSHIWGRAS